MGIPEKVKLRRATGSRLRLHHTGETSAALVVICYGFGPSNDLLRRILGLSHPGTVRLVDRLVTGGLAEHRGGRDKRAIALYLTEAAKTSATSC